MNKSFRIVALLILGIALLAAACTPSSPSPSAAPTQAPAAIGAAAPTAEPAATPEPAAEPSYKDTVEEFIIAYLPNEATEEFAQARNLMADELSAHLGIPVQEFNAADYNATVEAMRTGHASMAFFGPVTYVQAAERAQAEVMCVSADNGDLSLSGYTSKIIVRADSEFQTLEDLRGATFAFVDPGSTSGNYVPTLEFMNAFSMTNEDIHNNGTFFESVTFSGSHQNGLQAVLNGDVDAAPIASDILAREIAAGNANEADIRVIHESAKIPNGPMAIDGSLPQDLKDAVLEFMLAYDNDEYFIAMMGQEDGENLRFVQVPDSDYDYVRELMEKVLPAE